MAGRLAGRIAVVTGGSAGIGQEIARKLSSEGADIALADVNPADETKALVEANGQRFLYAKVDVSDEAQVNSFAAEVRNALGRADIVVNNAAVLLPLELEQVTLEHWKLSYAVNVDGPFLTTRAFLEDLKHSSAGRMINITSGSYFKNVPHVAYVSSKGAVNGLTYALAANLGKYDITVNAIAPSVVWTAAMLQAADEIPDMEKLLNTTVQSQDLERRQMPADVADTVAFLASDEAGFITGQIISVDGGLTRR